LRAAREPLVVDANYIGKRRFGARLPLEKLFATAQEFGIISLGRKRSLWIGAAQFNDARCDTVQECSVMGDEHTRTGRSRQSAK